jgi:hypothetical protein
VLPQVAEHRHLAAGDVVGDRHARQLDDAAFDGVHQREVAHRPGEQRALGVAGAAQEERRGRQVVDRCDAQLALDGFETGDPQAGGLVVLLGLLLVVALEVADLGRRQIIGFSAIAVMGLVVEDQ